MDKHTNEKTVSILLVKRSNIKLYTVYKNICGADISQ